MAQAVRVQQENSELEKETTYEEVCTDMKKRSEGDMEGFLYSRETSGSSDFERLISGNNDAKAGIVLDLSSMKSRKVA